MLRVAFSSVFVVSGIHLTGKTFNDSPVREIGCFTFILNFYNRSNWYFPASLSLWHILPCLAFLLVTMPAYNYTSAGRSPNQIDPFSNLGVKVIEYLVKKGYNRTEQMLRQESSNLDKDGKPIPERVEDLGTQKWTKAFQLLSNWVDSNLDIYKVS